MRLSRRNLSADENRPADVLRQVNALFLQQFLGSRQFADGGAGEQVMQCQHRVRLAATEVGLQLDDRVSPLARQSQHCLRQESAKPLSQEGSAEELGRILVLVRSFALINLPEIGGELGLLVAARCNVRVWSDDFPPRLQGTVRLAFGRLDRLLSHLLAALVVEHGPHQVHTHLADFRPCFGG